MQLHNESIDVGPNIEVQFHGAFYMAGRSSKGPWTCLEIRFAQGALFLKEKWFQPADPIENRLFKFKLKQLLDVLSGEDKWDSIPIVSKSWRDFYSLYIEALQDCRGQLCYIKTVPKQHYKQKEEYEAITADGEFISLTPTMEYTTLEQNQLDYYGIAPIADDPVPTPKKKRSKKPLKNIPY